MDESVLIFTLPLIIGLIAYFFNLKNEDKSGWKRITAMGVFVIILSMAYFLFGIYDLSNDSTKEHKYLETIDSLKTKSDSIEKKLSNVESKANTYYDLLQDVAFKLDTTTKDARKDNINIINLIKEQVQMDNTLPRFVICPGTENLKIEHRNGDTTLVWVAFCNYTKTIHDLKIKYYILVYDPDLQFMPQSTNDWINNSNPRLPLTSFRNYTGMDKIYFNNRVFIYFKGSYLDDMGKKYHFNQMVVAIPGSPRFEHVADENSPRYKAVVALLKKNNVY